MVDIYQLSNLLSLCDLSVFREAVGIIEWDGGNYIAISPYCLNCELMAQFYHARLQIHTFFTD